MVIRMQGFNMWRMRSFDRNARVDYWKLFYKVIQEQKRQAQEKEIKEPEVPSDSSICRKDVEFLSAIGSEFYELLGKKNICDNIHTALEVARHYLNR